MITTKQFIGTLLGMIRIPISLLLHAEIVLFNDVVISILRYLTCLHCVLITIRVITLLHNMLIGRIVMLICGYWRINSIFTEDKQSEERLYNL